MMSIMMNRAMMMHQINFKVYFFYHRNSFFSKSYPILTSIFANWHSYVLVFDFYKILSLPEKNLKIFENSKKNRSAVKRR